MFKQQNKSRKNDRFEFLQSLLNKYKCPDTSREDKHEILAHLTNFAYDPTNREYFRRLNIVKEYFEILRKPSVDFLTEEFIWAGICNLSVDPSFQQEIVNDHLEELFFNLQKTKNNNICLYILGSIFYLELKEKAYLCENLRKVKENKFEDKRINFLIDLLLLENK